MPTKLRYIRASDATAWSHCPRRAWYDYNPPAGYELVEDRFDSLIADFGIAHEAQVKQLFPDIETATSAEHTRLLMARNVPAIYQPVLVNDDLQVEGRPDFLIKTPSGNYQVGDAKSASSMDDKPEILIQLGVYRKLLGTPEPAVVFLGTGETALVTDKHAKKADEFLSSIRAILGSDSPPTAHFGESKCKACPYDAVCRPKFIADGEITLVYGIQERSVPGLTEQGVCTIHDLSFAEPEKLTDVPYLKGIDKKKRAILQAKSLLTGEIFETSPINLPGGTWIHFDVESNPLSSPPSVYLWGWLPPPYTKESFQYTWSDGTEQHDRAAWMAFLRKINEYRQLYPDLVLTHFAHFEITQIKLYAARYGMEQDPIVEWLLGASSPLYDLQKPVMQSLVLPITGYGLKYICKDPRLVNFQWELKESGSQWSVVRYIDYCQAITAAERESIKQEILSYNRDDVRATRALEVWLRQRPRNPSSLR